MTVLDLEAQQLFSDSQARGLSALSRRELAVEGSFAAVYLLTATLIAVFLIPVLFVLCERLALKLKGKATAQERAEFAS